MGKSSIHLAKEVVRPYCIITRVVIVTMGLLAFSVSTWGQNLKDPEIYFCDINDSEFEQALIRNLGYNLVAVQQNYLPVDSFGVPWSAENRVHSLPLTWGIALDSSVIVFEPTLSPWLIDTFFQLNQKEYFWEKGQLTGAKFWTMPGLNANDVAFSQDTINVDTLSPGVFAYQKVSLPQVLEVVSPGIFERPLDGHLLYFKLIESGYQFCMSPGTFSTSEGAKIVLGDEVKGGIFLVPEVEKGRGEITMKLAGYLTPTKGDYSQFSITPYIRSEE